MLKQKKYKELSHKMSGELEEGGDERNPESERATYTLFVTEVDSLKSLPGYTSDQRLWNPANRTRNKKNQLILTKYITAAKTTDSAPFKVSA